MLFIENLRAFRLSSPEYLKHKLDIILSAFINLGYPAFVIRGVISEAKTKYLSSDPAPRQLIPDTGMRTLSFPFHTELRTLNASIRTSNHRIVFTSSNTIGRAVVSKRGTQAASAYHRSGVYSLIVRLQIISLHIMVDPWISTPGLTHMQEIISL